VFVVRIFEHYTRFMLSPFNRKSVSNTDLPSPYLPVYLPWTGKATTLFKFILGAMATAVAGLCSPLLPNSDGNAGPLFVSRRTRHLYIYTHMFYITCMYIYIYMSLTRPATRPTQLLLTVDTTKLFVYWPRRNIRAREISSFKPYFIILLVLGTAPLLSPMQVI